MLRMILNHSQVQRVQETADLKTSKANIPVTLTKIRERGSTVTSTSNDSEGSTVVTISDYRTTDNSGILKAKGSKTLYGAADLELGAHSAPESPLISKNTPVFVPTAVYGTTLSIMLAILYLTTFLLQKNKNSLVHLPCILIISIRLNVTFSVFEIHHILRITAPVH